MSTGENEQGLRSITDFTRLLSVAILLLHFYIDCHAALRHWGATAIIVDRVMLNIGHLPVFGNPLTAKLSALLLLAVFLTGIKGKKDEKINLRTAIAYTICGLILYFISHFFLLIQGNFELMASVYMGMTVIGYLLILSGGALLSRILKLKMKKDIFNKFNESFPQEERLIENEYSLNFPARYRLKGKLRNSWINVINVFRALLITGTPGAGKTYFVVRSALIQMIKKQYSLFIYDFKYDDLSRIAYNTLLKYGNRYKIPPAFYVLNFDRPMHRCNPLDPDSMVDITDAAESARTILLGLNREWIKKQGEFFTESPINFMTAVIWFLRKYKNGIYCTLPHAIELMMVEYRELFPLLRSEPECEPYVNPFVSAFQNRAMEQLEGQVASAKIALARLASPNLYYVLTGNDFNLEINDPEAPKIVCAANNPEKSQIYGAVISLYVFRLLRVILKKGRNKCGIVVDELPSIFLNGIEQFVAVARSYKAATLLCVQDFSQLSKDYGKALADVIINICGNIIAGQGTGDTAKQLSERFGRIVQERESISINRHDTSISRSSQLDTAIPPSTIASLSSGEFVGIVSDNPEEKIELKAFHAEIVNDHEAIKREMDAYEDIPAVRAINQQEIMDNYNRIKEDIQELKAIELENIKNDPEKAYLLFVDKKQETKST